MSCERSTAVINSSTVPFPSLPDGDDCVVSVTVTAGGSTFTDSVAVDVTAGVDTATVSIGSTSFVSAALTTTVGAEDDEDNSSDGPLVSFWSFVDGITVGTATSAGVASRCDCNQDY